MAGGGEVDGRLCRRGSLVTNPRKSREGKEKMADEEEKSDEQMLSEMLADDGSLFIGGDCGPFFVGPAGSHPLGIYVNCNDLFEWGTADAEALPSSEIPTLYKAWLADKKHGMSIWACFRRKWRPQKPVEKRWREAGIWNDSLEALE